MTRPDKDYADNDCAIRRIKKYIDPELSGYSWNCDENCFVHLTNKKIYVCNVTRMFESSSEIRYKILTDDNWEKDVQKKVADYIKKKGLYK
jgi:nicotinic acid mononucleotide adenylyltransferase